jgi:chorismate mutase
MFAERLHAAQCAPFIMVRAHLVPWLRRNAADVALEIARRFGMDITDWRQRIDELDEQIVGLISRRAEAARAIGELKRGAQLPVYEPGREQAVFDHVRTVNPGPLADGEMLHVYERIIDVMRTLQRRDA